MILVVTNVYIDPANVFHNFSKDAAESILSGNEIYVTSDNFHPQPGFQAVYKFNLPEAKKPLIVKVDHTEMECYYGDSDTFDVEMQISSEVMNEIVQGRMTFQRAFMAGDMKMKGDFKVLRTLDLLYTF